MKRNIGKTDTIIRVVIGLSFLTIGLIYGSWWGLIGIIPLLTALTGLCPLYSLLRISSCPIKPKS